MAHRFEFTVRDVTCEHCEARVRDALEALPGTQLVEVVRTPQDEAQVVFETLESVEPQRIERVIEAKSAGTTHQYAVLWPDG